MKLKLSSISTKLTLTSGAGIALMIAISTASLSLSASVDHAVSRGRVQADVARNLVDLKASLRGMEIGAGQLRLAKSAEEKSEASSFVEKRHSSATKFLTLAEADMSLPANKERAKTIRSLMDEYDAVYKQLALDLNAGKGDTQPAADRLAALSGQQGPLVDDAVNAAKQRGEDVNDERRNLQNLQSTIGLLMSAAMIGLLIFSGIFGRKVIAKPISRITESMNALANGDLTAAIPYSDRKDEIGEMAFAVEIFKQNAIKVRDLHAQEAALQAQNADLQTNIASVVSSAVAGNFTARIGNRYENPDLNRFALSVNELVASVDAGVSETRRVIAALAEGDLTESMQGEFHGSFLDLQKNVNGTMDNLRTVMGEIRSAIDMINSGAGELRTASDDLSKRTEQQAASLEETAAALEEITSAVRNSTDRSSEASDMVAETRKSTEQSSNVVKSAVVAMGRIEQASGEISQIINVIDEIAFQTNLLALNAGVEAARAGEAGKGFAVVAQEVRELAQRSATAAKDIKSLINRSREEVTSGVSLVKETGAALTTIEDQVSKINGHVHSIATAAREQSTGLSEVNTAVNQMDQATQQNAAMVEESTAATNKLADEAANLSSMVARFKTETGRSTQQFARASRPFSPSPKRQTLLKVAGG